MSGSPVYAADGRLVGAVAYGLAGSSPIAGITPAAEMVKLLTRRRCRGGGAEVELTATLEDADRRQRRGHGPGSRVRAEATAASRLLVSGTSPARLRRITRLIRRTIHGVQVYPAGAASAQPAALAPRAGRQRRRGALLRRLDRGRAWEP